MKDNKIIIDPIDEALKLVYLDANTDILSELNHIVDNDYSVEISSEKAKQMITSLYEKLVVDSFGVLVSKAIEKENINLSVVANELNLPVSTIKLLRDDLILANSVPVVLFKNFLKVLKIPIEKAQESIIKTFHMLKNEIIFPNINSLQLTYKRKILKDLSSFNSKTRKSESQYLYQNEDALNKYLNRLNELYHVE